MLIKIIVDYLQCNKPTDNGIFNDRDEAYFLVAGGTKLGPIPSSKSRVSPPPPQDYFGLKAGESRRLIEIWEGFIPKNDFAAFSVLLREQDNPQLPALLTLAGAASGQLVALVGQAIFSQPMNLNILAAGVQEATKQFIQSVSTDGHDTVGGFGIMLVNEQDKIRVQWKAADGTTIETADNILSTQFKLSAVGEYIARTSVQRSSLVSIKAKHSGKVLDVPGFSQRHGEDIQQYTFNGGSNQRWLVKPAGGFISIPFAPFIVPAVVIYSDLSGQVLDVTDASTTSGSIVQQFPLHGGDNQKWGIIPMFDGSGDAGIISAHSKKALDVVGNSMNDGAQLQIYDIHFNANQRWKLEPVSASL